AARCTCSPSSNFQPSPRRRGFAPAPGGVSVTSAFTPAAGVRGCDRRRSMIRKTSVLLCALAVALLCVPDRVPAADEKTLTVCGDPDNLPFSNQKLEGFENK